MSTMEEVKNTLKIYEEAGNNNIVLLHCVSNYPCSDESLNMKVIQNLKESFGMPIGYSDHSMGCEAAIMAVTMGACIVEKHFTIDKNLQGPDHKASATPNEFLQLVKSVRRAEIMLGSSEKKVQKEEQQMSQVSRKSIVMRNSMKSGDEIKLVNLELKRPGTGLMAKEINLLVGKKLNKYLKKNDLITF
jgi:N,N'-diacetyllegionaminate synthase